MFGPKKGNQTNKEKKEQEKAQVYTEFEGKQIDDVKKDYAG
jgi:Mor family transcriptional regulator